VRKQTPEAIGGFANHPSRRRRRDEIVDRELLVGLTEVFPERGRRDGRQERRADTESVAASDVIVDGPRQRMTDGVGVEAVVVEDEVTIREHLRLPGRPGEGDL